MQLKDDVKTARTNKDRGAAQIANVQTKDNTAFLTTEQPVPGGVTEKEPFLKKNAMAIFALITSIMIGVFNIHNNYVQNQKWEALNSPRLNPSSVSLVAFEELDSKEAAYRDWGYPVIYLPVIDNGVYTGKSRVYTDLVFLDPDTKKMVQWGPRIITTVAEANKEAERLKFKIGTMLRKHFQFAISFKNSGQLSAHDISVKIDVSDRQGKTTIYQSSSPMLEVGPGEEFKVYADLVFDLDKHYIDKEHFSILLDYVYAGIKQPTKERKILFDMGSNSWTWE